MVVEAERAGMTAHDPAMARQAATKAVIPALIDKSEDEAAAYEIERRLRPGEALRSVVQAVSEAVDTVFQRHLRPGAPN